MAKPIKATPTIKGKDAVRFYKILEANKSVVVPQSKIDEIREAAKLLDSITQKD